MPTIDPNEAFGTNVINFKKQMKRVKYCRHRLTNPFCCTIGSPTIVVKHDGNTIPTDIFNTPNRHSFKVNDRIAFSGGVLFGGFTEKQLYHIRHVIHNVTPTTYSFNLPAIATSTETYVGGECVRAFPR